jgi:hypothetical protein
VKAIRNARHVVARKPTTICYPSAHCCVYPTHFAYPDACDIRIGINGLILLCTIWRRRGAIKDLPCHRVARYESRTVVEGEGYVPGSSGVLHFICHARVHHLAPSIGKPDVSPDRLAASTRLMCLQTALRP